MGAVHVVAEYFPNSQSRSWIKAVTQEFSGAFPSFSAMVPFQIVQHLAVERADHQGHALGPPLFRRILLHAGDGPAGSIALQEQLETLAGVDPFIEGDLDDARPSPLRGSSFSMAAATGPVSPMARK